MVEEQGHSKPPVIDSQRSLAGYEGKTIPELQQELRQMTYQCGRMLGVLTSN